MPVRIASENNRAMHRNNIQAGNREMIDPLDLWPQSGLESSDDHAMCRYSAVTVSVIDALQSAHDMRRDLSNVIPGIDAVKGAVIVAESIEADALMSESVDALFVKPFDDLCDWSLAVLAQIYLDVVRELAGLTQPIPDHLRALQERAWTALEQVLDSPYVSPMLWYQDIYFDVAQEYRVRGDPRALTIMKRGLAHCLKFNEGDNAEAFLRDIAETHLWLGELDKALSLYTALIHNEPDNIWHYNSIALTFVDTGLSQLGILATMRGQSLLKATGDPAQLEKQFRGSLARLEACSESDKTGEVAPTVLSDFRESLSLAFDAGHALPYSVMARKLIPDLSSMPVKASAEMLTLPHPRQSVAATKRQIESHRPQAKHRSSDQSEVVSKKPLGRNDACWCGSGKKYKHCHLHTDRQGMR